MTSVLSPLRNLWGDTIDICSPFLKKREFERKVYVSKTK